MSWRFLPEDDQEKRSIYVVNHGWHTGIVVAADSLGPELSFLKKQFKNGRYYEFGWGDERFYRAGRVTIPLAARAMLWPTASVMHVVALPALPTEYFAGSRVVKVNISQQGHEYLNSALYNSFHLGENGLPVDQGEGLYGNSRFYTGSGQYFLTRTCNKWTAQSLYRAGIPINPVLTVTASGVMAQVVAALGKTGYKP
ncbi:MAG: DUF2459 domain-containing protein [Thermodesulfobacteriota bacterium]